MYNYPDEGINRPVKKYIQSLGDLSGKKTLDCPAGDGRASFLLKKQGADITAADLYPEFYKATDDHCTFVDLSEKLPFEDDSFDFAICQEGIEHIQDQLGCLQEFHRVLKPGGKLLITTPSLSHLRAKVSQLFVESDYWKRQAPSEIDSIWFSNQKDHRMYFGHVFLLNIQKLRTLSVFAGFKPTKYLRSEFGSTSILLFPFLYPLIVFVNTFAYIHSRVKGRYAKDTQKSAVAKEIWKLSCLVQTSICKDFVLELQKEQTKNEALNYLKNLSSS